MDQGPNTAEAGGHEHQCSEEAILLALELGMYCQRDGQCADNPNLSTEERRVLEESTTLCLR